MSSSKVYFWESGITPTVRKGELMRLGGTTLCRHSVADEEADASLKTSRRCIVKKSSIISRGWKDWLVGNWRAEKNEPSISFKHNTGKSR